MWGFAAFIAMIGVLLSGCYTLTIDMSVNEDGSGEAVMSIELHEEFLDAMAMADPEDEIVSRVDACSQMEAESRSGEDASEGENGSSLSSGIFGSAPADGDNNEEAQQTETVLVNDGERCVITERTAWDASDFAELMSDSEFPIMRTDEGHWMFSFPPGAGETAVTDDIVPADEDMAMFAALGVALPEISITAALPGWAVDHNADTAVLLDDGLTKFTWSRDISEIDSGTELFAVTHPDALPLDIPSGQAIGSDPDAALETAPSAGTTTTAPESVDTPQIVEEAPLDDGMSTAARILVVLLVVMVLAVLVALWLVISSRKNEQQQSATD